MFAFVPPTTGVIILAGMVAAFLAEVWLRRRRANKS